MFHFLRGKHGGGRHGHHGSGMFMHGHHHHGDGDGERDGERGQREHGGERGGRGRGGRGPKMFDAGAMRYVVLQLIAEKPRHGYEIIKEIEQRAGGAYAPSPGAIYPLLSMLLDLGHVSAAMDGNKKQYAVTPDGLAFLDENRTFVDVVMARLGRMATPDGGPGDLRQLMHGLKEAVITKARVEMPDEAKLAKISEIVRRATAEIVALD